VSKAALADISLCRKRSGCVPISVKEGQMTVDSVSVVVPVFNERENLPLLHDAVTQVMRKLGLPYELILVNDGSTDGSTQALERLTESDPNVKVVELRRNFGQTAAMQAGIEAASMSAIAFLDGDLQNDPADIPKMLAKLDEGYDLVHGWRKDRKDAFVSRKLPSYIANWIISRTTGYPVHDLGCTLKVMRAEVARELQLFGEMHRFIPILAHGCGARCAEVVTNHRPRKFGTSKYGISRTTRVVLDLLTVKYLLQYVVSPMKLFGVMGLACGGATGLFGAATLWMKLAGGIDITGNPLFALACLSSMMSVQFLFMGMLGEMCSRIYFQVRGRPNFAIRKTVNFDAEPATVPYRRATDYAENSDPMIVTRPAADPLCRADDRSRRAIPR
jgi:glycosyltransferase involved in cell wall biosynthesis